MDFFSKIRDTVHGWPEETRKFLAMTVMGVALVAFFVIWVSSASSHLIAIGLPPVAPSANTPPSSPTAFLPQDAGTEDGSTLGQQDGQIQPQDQAVSLGQTQPQGQPPVAGPSVSSGQYPSFLPQAEQEQAVQEQAPTPAQGMAETFSGLKRLFATTDDHASVGTWVQQALDELSGAIRRTAAYVLKLVRNAAQDFVFWLEGLAPQQFPAFNTPHQ